MTAPTGTDERAPDYWVCFWLESALNCKAFEWDPDQRECAEEARYVLSTSLGAAQVPDGWEKTFETQVTLAYTCGLNGKDFDLLSAKKAMLAAEKALDVSDAQIETLAKAHLSAYGDRHGNVEEIDGAIEFGRALLALSQPSQQGTK